MDKVFLHIFFYFSLILFQREYKKQQAQTVHDYRGYQTMDSRVHPDVVRGQKASDLISDVSLNFLSLVASQLT